MREAIKRSLLARYDIITSGKRAPASVTRAIKKIHCIKPGHPLDIPFVSV